MINVCFDVLGTAVGLKPYVIAHCLTMKYFIAVKYFIAMNCF